MIKSFDDYLDLTKEAIILIEKKDIFKFEQIILKRNYLIKDLSLNLEIRNNLNISQKNEILLAESYLKKKAEEIYAEIKNDLSKIKTEKTINKYSENVMLERVENTINSKY